MDNKEIFFYKDEEYSILMVEYDLYLPENIKQCCPIDYVVKDNYQLYIQQVPVNYSGGFILGHNFLKDYRQEKEQICYSYEKVIELIFQEGILETSVDHSKAMLRVRKNLDKGYRNLKKRRDRRCIKRFVYHSFIRKYYHSFFFQKKKKLSKQLYKTKA